MKDGEKEKHGHGDNDTKKGMEETQFVLDQADNQQSEEYREDEKHGRLEGEPDESRTG